MKKLTVLLLFVQLTGLCAFAQRAIIKGSVIDTAEKTNLAQSVIALIRYDDSVLVKFTRSDANGHFQLKQLPAGRFFLMVTHPSYADFVDIIALTPDTVVNIGNTMMTPRAKLLEEVVVRQNIAIRIKGDTIEYKADSFKVAEGSNVQELLKRLPGFQVDRNGQITAHGKTVEKILVDGEEFFSDDPAVVTQNLRADAIDKVQAFDKKSDQAEFTGIDDGERTKTVNLVMKEDKKKGYFGKISAGLGTNGRTNDEAMINYFKGKKKMSAYGIYSNTGKTGLDWGDRDKFGGGNFGDDNVEINAGFIMITSSLDGEFDDGSSEFYGEGIPRSLKAGAHFSNKWNNDINHISSNYSFNRMDIDAAGGSLTKYILPDSAYYFGEQHRNVSARSRHLFTGMYDIKLDSLSSIRFRLNGTAGNNRSDSRTESESRGEDMQLVNRNERNNYATTDNKAVQASVLWRQRLRKKGRTLSVSASHKYSDNTTTGYLFSDASFFDGNGNVYDRDSVDQLKETYSKTLTSQSRFVYTEPLSKRTTLEVNYTFNRNAYTSDRKSFDKINGKYESLNELFSNNYSMLFYSNTGGARVQYNGKKLIANIGANAGVSNYIQRDSVGMEVNHFRYTNLFPNAQLHYRFSTQRSLVIRYNGSPRPPSIQQVQPVLQNNDPLNIVVGNPDLKQAFSNNFSLFYNDYKVLTGRSVWINASYTSTYRAIVQSQETDAAGKRTLQYVNTNGNYNYWFSGTYHFKIKKPEIEVSISANTSGGRNTVLINGIKNVSDNNRIGGGPTFYRYKENKYEFSLGARYYYNRSISSINKQQDNAFWTQNYTCDMEIYIGKRFRIGTRVDANLREKVDAFDANNNVVSWNGWLTYRVFQKRNGELRLEGFDLLNQRKGFERNFNANFVTERTYQVLRQYFMLTFTWDFTKTPGAPAKND